ncbi:hypothetical protein F5Y15DRAFT_218242 [Xylariaceae sp. FL0016]|nr:hypothetical protein F5Y15DRAFT_218242 [Xylariaceae sp. FL0016]
MGADVISAAPPKGELFSISPETLFALPDQDYLLLIKDEFLEELERLKRAYSIPTDDTDPPSTSSPSQILYGTDYDEVNRTLVGVLALKWIHNGNYESFVAGQDASQRLARESFDWIRERYSESGENQSRLYALLTSMVVNDLGKDSELAKNYQQQTGQDISAMNHDMILLKAVHAGLVPCLDRLVKTDKDDIILGMELGAELNFGQLAQAENAPACLSKLQTMRGHEAAFQLRFMEQLLDIAGAAGHMDWTGAKKLIQPIFEAYRNVHDAAMGIISGGLSLRAGYDLILSRRLELLQKRGLHALNIHEATDRAFTRLLCMGGVADEESARLYDQIWHSLDSDVRSSLVETLNVDGSTTRPAVQPTYMPALLTHVAGSKYRAQPEERKKALGSVLHYLSRVMTDSRRPEASACVIERGVRPVLQEVARAPNANEAIKVLSSAKIPEGVPALAEL